ncbi:MAG: TonB-dependent receptor [Bacteroidales bacterium]|nr:TonB-dependent receptor [Bacteroidales bacterium]
MKKVLFALSFMVMVGLQVLAQTTNITGTVTDATDGSPIPGVSVFVKGTTIGTVTTPDGTYTLAVPNDASAIVFSFVGMTTQEIAFTGQSTINAVMKSDAVDVDEVIVVAYGTATKKSFTGTAAKVDAERLESKSVSNISQALQGEVAGVQVIADNGQPGSSAKIRIRGIGSINGSRDPLYIVDGAPLQGDINAIAPSDIQSTTILKDASATAIYGSRGANGVVLITTKRGQTGEAKVNVNYSYGLQKVEKKFDRLTGPEYAQRHTEARAAGGEQPWYDGSTFYRPLPQNAATVNWQDEVYRVAPHQVLSVSVNGGNKKSKYLLSGKVSNQEGIMINSGYKDAQVRMNLDTEISDFISVGANIAINHSKNELTTTGATVGINMVNLTLATPPTYEIDWVAENGRWWTNPEKLYETTNPVKFSEDVTDFLVTNRLLGNAFVDMNLTSDLKFHGSAGIDHSDGERNIYYPRTITLHNNVKPGGQGSINRKVIERKMANGYFSYNKELGEHSLAATVGAEVQNQMIKTRNMHSENFTSDNLTTNNLGEGLDNIRVGSYKDEWQTIGFFGRVNYNFSSRYLLTANFRYDGSSRFGADNKWGFFPSIAGAWRAIEEGFMQDQITFTDLKVRASVGQTGNGDIPVYSSLGTWAISGNRYPINDVLGAGARLSRLANPELKWETTTQYNFGLDLGFLNNRLGVNLDYYVKNTDDLILNVVVPITSGFTSATQNVGSLKNTGFEFNVNWVVTEGKFKWDMNLNGASYRAEATDIGDNEYLELAAWDRWGGTRLYEGEPAGQIFGYNIIGVFKDQAQADSWPVDHGSGRNTEGYYIYEDYNGDGKISDADRHAIGNGQPDLVYGFTNNFEWKDFELSLFFQGTYGNDIVNLSGAGDASETIENEWTPDRREGVKYAANKTGGNGRIGLRVDNLLMRDGSYLRLKDLRLGYNIPVKNIPWIERAKVYMNATNVFTLTEYNGYSPDVSSGGTAAFGEGWDTGGYPQSKTITMGINVTF